MDPALLCEAQLGENETDSAIMLAESEDQESAQNNKIKLKDFDRKISKSWKDLQKQTDFCDVTLACDEKQIKAHKVILSCCSSVFEQVLKNNPHPHPIIYLQGVKYQELVNILDFIYQGEVNIDNHNLKEFLVVADDLKIKGLAGDEKTHSTSVSRSDQFKNKDTLKQTTTVGNQDLVKMEVVENENVGNEQIWTPNVYKPDLLIQEKRHKCEQCDFHSTSKSNLKKHVQSKHDGIRYFCDQCDHITTQNSHLKAHIRSKHKDNTIVNDNLKIKGLTGEERTNSIAVSDPDFFANYLNNEDDSFQIKSEEIEDMEDMTNQTCESLTEFNAKPFSFETEEIDQSTFVFKTENIEYEQFSAPSENSDYQVNPNFYKPTPEKHHKCEQCDFYSTTKSNLKKHVQSQHDGIRYQCPHCDHTTSQKIRLKSHILSKHDNNDHYEYHCEKCAYRTNDKPNLNRHIASQHDGILYYCDQCDYKSKQRSLLKGHIEAKHEGVQYNCDKCDYKGAFKGSLRKHIVKHHLNDSDSALVQQKELTMASNIPQ